jgi:hypothetical protein
MWIPEELSICNGGDINWPTTTAIQSTTQSSNTTKITAKSAGHATSGEFTVSQTKQTFIVMFSVCLIPLVGAAFFFLKLF